MSWQNRFEQLRSNKLFETFIIVIIITSALLVGAKTYEISPFILSAIGWLDFGVTVIFVIEITVRFLGEENKRNFFKQGWNIFDTIIVVVSLIPINDSEMVLVARLVRVFRVLRMVSIIPELRFLLNSLLIALPRLGYVAALLFIIFYIYAAVGSLLFEDINPTLWGDIAISMLTLFRVMTFEDWTDVMYETMEIYPISWIFYISFIFLTAFAFLNMVIGIIVGVMEEEHEKAVTEDPDRHSLENIYDELKEMKSMLAELKNKSVT